VTDVAVLAALIGFPIVLPGYLDLGTRMIVMAMCAMSLDLLVGYCGLGPRVYSSGGKTFHGPISKEGNKFLRWALVEAAQKYGIRPGPIGNFYRRVKVKKGSKSARVAVARKLATVIWQMLTKGEDFDESKIAADRQRQRFVMGQPEKFLAG